MSDSAPVSPQTPRTFQPDDAWAAQLASNRAGLLTSAQRTTVMIGAVGSSVGLACVSVLFINVAWTFLGRLQLYNAIFLVMLALFSLSFGYMWLTLYWNARWYLPDLLAKTPVQQAKGKLQIKMAARERPILPFSYIVEDYSFGPFEVPHGVPMEKGRKYIVYYLRHSRMFLNIEPQDYNGRE
jgi:hypothetical protein